MQQTKQLHSVPTSEKNKTKTNLMWVIVKEKSSQKCFLTEVYRQTVKFEN